MVKGYGDSCRRKCLSTGDRDCTVSNLTSVTVNLKGCWVSQGSWCPDFLFWAEKYRGRVTGCYSARGTLLMLLWCPSLWSIFKIHQSREGLLQILCATKTKKIHRKMFSRKGKNQKPRVNSLSCSSCISRVQVLSINHWGQFTNYLCSDETGPQSPSFSPSGFGPSHSFLSV